MRKTLLIALTIVTASVQAGPFTFGKGLSNVISGLPINQHADTTTNSSTQGSTQPRGGFSQGGHRRHPNTRFGGGPSPGTGGRGAPGGFSQ